jgi:hypothetical protein
VRSPQEIVFRLRQEAANLLLALLQPSLSSAPPSAPLGALPDPMAAAARLRDTPFAATVISLANEICRHRFPLFDVWFDLGPHIDWRRDAKHGITVPIGYFRGIPYLDFDRSGDHKYIWELSRHHHLPLLAQAWLFSGERRYLDHIGALWTSWEEQNPFQRSINWTSALEVAFRALSLIWTYHFAGGDLPSALRRRLWTALYRHGLHLEYNLSIYFSPNTHLLGEAVALHALGTLFPALPRAARWRKRGREITLGQLDLQVAADGSHFEQSTYYHVYTLDFFVLHHILDPLPPEGRDKLKRMARFLEAVLGPSRRLPFLGDDDGGRLFHPYGARDTFARATLATCAALLPEENFSCGAGDGHEQSEWWLGVSAPVRARPAASVRFPQSGIAVMSAGEIHILADTGAFGHAGAGHSHSDTLSVVIRRGDEEILIDPGTCTYVSDAAQRDWFRSSAAHNTIRIDGCDQAEPASPFRWRGKPRVELLQWASLPEADYLDARSNGHRRRFYFDKRGERLLILDTVEGAGRRLVEQFWHLGHQAASGRMAFTPADAVPRQEWRSRVFGSRESAPVLQVTCENAALPLTLATAVDLSASPRRPELVMETAGEDVLLYVDGRCVRFPARGAAE